MLGKLTETARIPTGSNVVMTNILLVLFLVLHNESRFHKKLWGQSDWYTNDQ
jgi:hypothetical protein